MKNTYKFKAEVWLYPSETAAWHFVTVDKKLSEEIRKKHGKNHRGFGSLPVEVTVGKTKWKTSVFPERKDGVYILPLKSQVRMKEGIRLHDKISVGIKVLV